MELVNLFFKFGQFANSYLSSDKFLSSRVFILLDSMKTVALEDIKKTHVIYKDLLQGINSHQISVINATKSSFRIFFGKFI